MAVFRVEKNKNYTTMSNYHLRDKNLSNKSRGLLSTMLSLPEDWDYTTRGLATICKDGVESITTQLKELEKYGYLVRKQLRNNHGRLAEMEYVIYEKPQKESPCTGSPYTGNPYTVNPDTEDPYTENTAQLNKDILNTEELNTDDKIDKMDGADSCREEICKNIEYPWLVKQYGQDRVDEIVELMVETIMIPKEYITIEGTIYPQQLVRERYLKLTSEHIQYVFECMDSITTKIRNIKAYLRTTLYNASTTIDNYYRAEANHDFGKKK